MRQSSFRERGTSSCYIFRSLRPTYNPNVLTPTKGFGPNSTLAQAPPLHWRKPDIVLTCSQSDFFHPDADPWRPAAWDVIRQTQQYNIVYRILTKRIQRVLFHPNKVLPPDWVTSSHPNGYPNVWLGTSIEREKYYWRIDMLQKTPAVLKWLSLEPLLEPLPHLAQHLDQIKLVYAGGESDLYHPRLANAQWFADIRDLCAQKKIPFHFLQMGGKLPCRCGCWSKFGCRRLFGKWHQQFPVPTLIAEGRKQGKRQRERVLNVLRKHHIPMYKTPVQRESTRGNPRQVDRILLINPIDQTTLDLLQAQLSKTKLTLETWP